MRKLIIPPDNTAYAAQRGGEVLSVKLDGGASRFRTDVLNAAWQVDTQWILDADGYNYMNAFFRTATVHGSLPFKIDLILDGATLTDCTVHFVPNSFKLTQQQGLAYYVTASLEVAALPEDADDDNDTLDAYETANGGLIGDV